ncbi:MAG TPA: hypothetical protein PL009_08065, partial [Flavipsychrobacter sp.]|nr:hypothetical protein [Flavipsychrobacter sp.]
NTLIVGAIAPGTYNIALIVRDGQGNNCSRSMTLVVPQLPVAAYTVTSTDPLSTPSALSSCELRAVDFTSASTGSIVHHDWQFGDFTSSWIAPVTTRVYTYNSLINPAPTSLTVTDAYGCTSTATDTITIIENNIGFGSNPNAIYTPQNQILCAGNLATVQLTSMIGGVAPFSYNWHESTQSLGAPSSATLSNISAAGAYWVAVEDAHGCQASANPTPATVNFINAPPVIIQGEQHRCDGENIQLSAAAYAQAPATLSYSWVRNPGNVAAGTTKDITETGLAPGIYTYTLTQTYTPQPGGPTCVTTSAPYQVEVHALPAPPTLSLQMLDCNTYEVELTATHSFVPPYTLNWSTGQTGSPISVFNGGPYRAWVTDLYGCKSHEDIDVPVAPNTFFWRFPQNACYTYCRDELPRHIDGPSYHVFDTWEWLHNSAPVTANGPYSGSGSNSVCDPLWLE